jgi:hypothetical protein
MYAYPRRLAWYLALVVAFLFILKDPVAAGHLARAFGHLLSDTAVALSKMIGSR